MNASITFRTALILGTSLAFVACERNSPTISSSRDETVTSRVVEAGCGQCLFDLPGQGCTLAVRFDGQAYYVSGSSIDDHGDAHAADGLCNAIRPAEATGQLRDAVFVADRIVLVPAG